VEPSRAIPTILFTIRDNIPDYNPQITGEDFVAIIAQQHA
jgi:hypothetical protein